MANYWWQDDNSQPDNSDWWKRQQQLGAATPDDGQSSFFGSLIHGAENVGHAVETGAKEAGSFFGGIIKGIASDAATTVKTGKDIVQAVVDNKSANSDIDKNTADYKQATQDYNAGKISLEQLHQKYQQFQQKSSDIGQRVSNEGINQDQGLKSGAAAANTFLNVATLGVGGGIKSLAEGGAKEALQAGAENGLAAGIKTGAKAAASNGSDQAQRQALSEAVQQGGKPAARAAVGHFADQAGGNAAFGAAQGGLQSESQNNGQGLTHDALLGALTGGAIGSGGALLNSDVRKGLAEVPDQLSKGARDLKDRLPSGQLAPLGQAGHVNPGFAPLNDRPGNSVPDDFGKSGPAAQTPDEQNSQDLVHAVASNFSSPEQYIKQAADAAYNYDKTQSGGNIQRTADGGFTRTTTHTPFYSDYFAEHGKAPSKAAFQEQVQKALDNGTDGGGLVHPGEADIYQHLKDQKGSSDAALQDPSARFEQQRQQNIDALNGQTAAPSPASGPTVTPEAAPTSDISAPDTTAAPSPPGGGGGTGPIDPTGVNANAEQRGFFDTLQNSDNTNPQLKKAIAAEPQTYAPRNNEELAHAGKVAAENDPLHAQMDILSKGHLNDQDITTGHHLISKAQAEGRMEDAVSLADKLDRDLRESGRSVQAASIWSRLTPEGTLRLASRKLSQARDSVSNGRRFTKGVGNEDNVAQEIKSSVEGAGTPDRGAVTQAVRDTANSKIPAGLPAKPGEGQLDLEGNPHVAGETTDTTGQKIANRVEKAVSPQVKQKADALVDELTKKVKQEMLPEKAPTARKPALDILKEVFDRNSEAQEAFPEAQRILRERFADNPKAQEQLDKFFNSELDHPAAGSTINQAIKDQMTQNESKISDIIHKSYSDQAGSVQEVSDALTKEGFDQASADIISKEVTDRLNSKIAEAKASKLQQLAKEAPKRNTPTYLDKVNKMSNLGALTDQDYLELARSKLDLPQLTPGLAKDIFKLSQKMQDTPEGYERDQLAKQIYERTQEAIPKSKKDLAGEVISAPKAIMASADLSGTLRQGGVLGARFRTEAKDAFKAQIRYFKSTENFDREMSAIKQDPDYVLAQKANIAMTAIDGSEEAFVSQLPEKIPVAGKVIQASDRAYTGGLTKLRFDSFKHIMNDLRDSGIDPSQFGEKQLESIGKYINTASGRGYGAKNGLFEKVAPALNRTLFSPRLWKSRLDMLNPAFYYKLDPVARKYALQSARDFAGIASMVLGLASLAGAQVSVDPRSSDFLKIRVGDTRYDILGGFQQNLVFAARELSGQSINSSTGATTKLGDGTFGGATRTSVLSDLVQNKANPVIGTAINLGNGVDKNGNPVNLKNELGSLVIPLNVQDTASLAGQADPFTALFGALIPGSLGVGVNTYGANSGSSGSSQYKQFSDNLTGSNSSKNPWQ